MPDSYQASLDYLYSLQFFGIKLGLNKVCQLLERIDNPQRKLRIVHIAGTNGKGSTAATLANIFHAAGISAGLYTSPHLHSFTERIRVDLAQIPDAEVVRLTDELRPHAEELQTTFFEFTTAMALLYFQRSGAEWAILEVGMGGRLDATNVAIPELCLISPIGLDHTAQLGQTLAEVAGEKAGIFKTGVPIVSARQELVVIEVLREKAQSLSAPIGFAGKDYFWTSSEEGFSFLGCEQKLTDLHPGLLGQHQQQNLALALAAAEQLRQQGVSLPDTALRKGVETTRWPGRLEWLPGQILIDGAHNPAGARMLAAYLEQQQLRNVHLLVGLKADKPAAELLGPLLPYVARLYATEPPVEAVVPPETLVLQAEKLGVKAAAYSEPQAALRAALEARGPGEVLLVAGSLFLVAAVRETLLPTTKLLSITI